MDNIKEIMKKPNKFVIELSGIDKVRMIVKIIVQISQNFNIHVIFITE
jgi:hypothetical protein